MCYVQTDLRAAWTTVTAGEVTGPESVQGGGQRGRGGTGGGSHAFPLEKWGSRARNRQFTERRKLGGGTTLVPLDLPKRHLMVPCPALRCVTRSFSLVLPCGPPASPTWTSHSRCISRAAVSEERPGPRRPVPTSGQGAPARSPRPVPALGPDAGRAGSAAGPRRLVPWPRCRALPRRPLLHRNAPAILAGVRPPAPRAARTGLFCGPAAGSRLFHPRSREALAPCSLHTHLGFLRPHDGSICRQEEEFTAALS